MFTPESTGIRLGGAFESRGQWVVFTGDAFKKRQVEIVKTASDARDSLELLFGSLEETELK